MQKFKEITVDIKLTPEMILKQILRKSMSAQVNEQTKTDLKVNKT